jgi:transposase
MPRRSPALSVSAHQQEQIDGWLAALGTPQQVALRCLMVPAAGSGQSEVEIASALNINRKTVRLWRARFATEGLQALWEIAPGRGRKPTYGPDRVKAVIDATLQSKPKGGAHWSCRTLAADQGVSKSTVSNILRRRVTKQRCRTARGLHSLPDVC